jgi:hypothetical protein
MPQSAPSAEAPQTRPAAAQSNAVTSREVPFMLQLTRVLPLQVSWAVVSQTAACAEVGLEQARISSQVEAAEMQVKTDSVRLSPDASLGAKSPTAPTKYTQLPKLSPADPAISIVRPHAERRAHVSPAECAPGVEESQPAATPKRAARDANATMEDLFMNHPFLSAPSDAMPGPHHSARMSCPSAPPFRGPRASGVE